MNERDETEIGRRCHSRSATLLEHYATTSGALRDATACQKSRDHARQ